MCVSLRGRKQTWGEHTKKIDDDTLLKTAPRPATPLARTKGFFLHSLIKLWFNPNFMSQFYKTIEQYCFYLIQSQK